MQSSSSSSSSAALPAQRSTVLTAGGVGRSASPRHVVTRVPPTTRQQQPEQQPPPQSQTEQPFGNDDEVDDDMQKKLEYELDHHSGENNEDDLLRHRPGAAMNDTAGTTAASTTFAPYSDDATKPASFRPPPPPHTSSGAITTTSPQQDQHHKQLIWLVICFLGIMASFVCYGLLLEYTTSGGRQLHELSFLFVTSGLYTLTAAAGRYVRDETPTTIPPARFAVLGLTSMGSTFCSVRSLRYVIYPIQVLAKSCKPVPVMLMGALMGKRYPARKYFNVILIVLGVALFMGGGSGHHQKPQQHHDNDDESSSTTTDHNNNTLQDRLLAATSGAAPNQIVGLVLLFASLCFDGGTGAYEDKLMSVHSVQPFDLMYNIQLGKTILAGIGLLVLNQMHIFLLMVQEMGFLLVALGLSGAIGQVFIFITIAKFGALTCSIIGLARKVTTLVASIYFYGHFLNAVQFTGLVVSVASMVLDFCGKKKGKGDKTAVKHPIPDATPQEVEKILLQSDDENGDEEEGGVELAPAATNGGTNKPNYY